MRERLLALHPVLKELIAGILFLGFFLQVSLVWVSSDKVLFSTGLWLGVFLSLFFICHMYRTLDGAMGMLEKDAQSRIRKGVALRFLLTVLAFLGIYFLKVGNLVAFFLGLLTLKFSAYLQPLIHKILTRKKKGG